MLMANFVMTRPTSNLHENVVLVRQHGVEMAYRYMFIVLVCTIHGAVRYKYKFEYT